MIQNRKERCIAKIISVNAYKLEAELLSHINSFNINGFEDIYQFIRLNGYVLVVIENNFIVASISSIREKDDKTGFTDKDALNKINSNKIIELFPLGVIEKKEFTFGVSNYPLLYSDVLYIKNDELDTLFKGKETDNFLEIGTWTLMDKYKIKIAINDFFAFHSAILGNTGSGKSCTISAILQSIYKRDDYKKSQFVFFDVNGEYKNAFINNNNIKLKYFHFNQLDNKKNYNEKKFYLPLNLLTIDEWELLLKASSKAQAPILRNALGLYSLCENETKNESKNSIKTYIFCRITKNLLETDTSFTVSRIIANLQKFNNPNLQKLKINGDAIKFQNLCLEGHYGDIKYIDEFKTYISELEKSYSRKNISFEYKNDCLIELNKLEEYIDIAISWEEAHGNKQVRDYCSSLITRLKSLSRRKEFKFFNQNKEVYNQKKVSNQKKVNQYVKGLINDNNITIINFDTIDDEVIEVVSAILARIFFDYTKNLENRNTEPIHLVLDEAHRYISNNRGKEYFFEAHRIFERIAKESRKFGLFLILSSQRPSEINETVISQCSNFIIHRIQNPNDLHYIKSMTPFISQSILNQLPAIPCQEALIFGTAVNIPVLFKVKNANPLPDSKNNKIVDNWTKNTTQQ